MRTTTANPELLKPGALIVLERRLYEVVRYAVGGMSPSRVIVEDFATGQQDEFAYDDVVEHAELIRAARETDDPVVPVSTECLIAEARALRAA